MSEEVERLRATIRELEAELQSLTEVDAQTRKLLEEARTEIEAKIGGPRAETSEQEPLSERLTTAAERWETTHPTLFGLATRLADALAQMGI
jgi:hypothetical protein